MKIVKTASQYTIDCDVKKLHKNDDKRGYINTVSTQLNTIDGVYDADYNGHYGNVCFLTIEAYKDNPKTWVKIKKILSPFLL
jgi:hypothetical protein